MTPTETSRVCCVCRKLFCCAQCRERHEKNKHPNRQPNCPLCMSQKLPLNFLEDKSLLCHIAIAHLPLYCCLCGEIFKQGKDLESFGTCKWWKSRQRHSLLTHQKSILGTPPLIVEEKESPQYNGNFCSLTSPPELYRNTSTPMGLSQKGTFDFITPCAPNFSLKTPQTGSASLKTDQTNSGYQTAASKVENLESNYMSLLCAVNHEETPFRSVSSNGYKEDPPRGNSRKMNVANGEDKIDSTECCDDNHCVEDMELTGVENKILPDSQGLEQCQGGRRSDSLKKVRFSDQYENPVEPNRISVHNMTENEEYYEACDNLPEVRESTENSQIKMYEENIKNTEKENRKPDEANANVGQLASGSSRVVMMVVVENDSTVPTADVIDSGLKRLERIASSAKFSISNRSSPGCSSSITTMDNYCSVSNRNYRSSPNESNSPISEDSSSSANSNDTNGSGGIFSAVANAVRSVMKNFSGIGIARNVERQQTIRRDVPRLSTSETLDSVSDLASSLLQRPGKRPRDTIESTSSSQRQMELASPIELRSPLAKRHRGWYRIKAREPIARMRNNHLASSRGVSSETQVFHQGSLSVGDTVLPLPSRAHQSTQTE